MVGTIGREEVRQQGEHLFSYRAVLYGKCLPHGGSRESKLLDPTEGGEDCIYYPVSIRQGEKGDKTTVEPLCNPEERG